MYMKILAALGASSTGQRARPEAIAQRWRSSVRLRLLHVVSEGPAIVNLEAPSQMEDYERALRKTGKRLRQHTLATMTTAGPDDELAALERSERGVRIVGVEPAKLPGGPVIEVRYAAESAPNPVTSKSVRLDCVSHYAWKAGQRAIVTFCAPAGADNADQWALMARSFKWK